MLGETEVAASGAVGGPLGDWGGEAFATLARAAGGGGTGAGGARVCAECGSGGAAGGLMECGACGGERYCGRACQAAHWKVRAYFFFLFWLLLLRLRLQEAASCSHFRCPLFCRPARRHAISWTVWACCKGASKNQNRACVCCATFFLGRA